MNPDVFDIRLIRHLNLPVSAFPVKKLHEFSRKHTVNLLTCHSTHCRQLKVDVNTTADPYLLFVHPGPAAFLHHLGESSYRLARKSCLVLLMNVR